MVIIMGKITLALIDYIMCQSCNHAYLMQAFWQNIHCTHSPQLWLSFSYIIYTMQYYYIMIFPAPIYTSWQEVDEKRLYIHIICLCYIVYDLGSNLPFMIHVEELAYQLIYGVLGLDFYVDGKKECQKEQNTTRDGDQLGNRQLTSMIIRSSIRNSILKWMMQSLIFFKQFICRRFVAFPKQRILGQVLG